MFVRVYIEAIRRNTKDINQCRSICGDIYTTKLYKRHWSLPDDHNDAIKDIIGILYVAKGPIDQHLQQHL